MRLSLLFLAKLLCQVGLFVFFLSYFGIPSLRRYQKQEVMVVSSTRHSGGIAAPTISVFAGNPISKKGWKSVKITTSVEIIEDQCGSASDIQRCIVEGTYERADVVEHAHIGFRTNESLMNPALWREDFTNSFYGRILTLSVDRRITPDYNRDQIFLHLQKNISYTIFIYHRQFFVLNTNILSFPVIIKDVSNSMGSHYWNLAVTERLELNHPNDPCYEGMICLLFNPIQTTKIIFKRIMLCKKCIEIILF